jgi:serine/threonine-protein kinase RsbW
LNVSIETVGLATLVIPQGRLDHSAAGSFQRQLEAALAGSGRAPAAVITDCGALDYVSSAGLRVFLLAARAAERAGIRFALCALRPAVREVFELSGFSRIIAVHPDRPTALALALPAPARAERRLAVASTASQLPVLTQFLQDFWSEARLPPGQSMAFELALEEIFMNIVTHGTPGGAQQRVDVSLVVTDGGLTMTFEDDGPPFDPLSLPAPDITARLEERAVGGLGVALMRRMMDSVSYHRIGTRNQLTVSRRIPR